MPRLPVEADDQALRAPGEGSPPREAVSIPAWQFGLFLGLVALSVVGDVYLADLLGIELQCLDSTQGRRGRFVEMIICTFRAGPTGWLLIAWFALPLLVAGFWLRRRAR